ncbi:hypothetical protein N7541_005415 [Penicillium brevicompactum]|uniref:Uncharacterized protein n=1 Tax=Penicillium brevicompactum TaxID=5074 RepID=A0A9W9UUW0_PENBR|nr:hypothetical protein N7541_005415 [Penicillium brevicompactum]
MIFPRFPLVVLSLIYFFTTTSAYDDTRILLNKKDSTAGYSRVPVIRIQSDGQTCPEGYQSAKIKDIPNVGLSCISDNLKIVGTGRVAENKATCCAKKDQKVFLVSVKGYQTSRPGAQYSLDGRTCCPTGQIDAKTNQGGCKKDAIELQIAEGQLTHCCWNSSKNDFNVHLKDYSDGIPYEINQKGNKSLDSSFCSTVYYQLGHATVHASYVEIDALVKLDCGSINGRAADRQRLIIRYNRKEQKAGAFNLQLNAVTVNAEVVSQLFEASTGKYDIKTSVKVTAGTLYHNSFDLPTIPHNDLLDSVINNSGVC